LHSESNTYIGEPQTSCLATSLPPSVLFGLHSAAAAVNGGGGGNLGSVARVDAVYPVALEEALITSRE